VGREDGRGTIDDSVDGDESGEERARKQSQPHQPPRAVWVYPMRPSRWTSRIYWAIG